MTGQEFTDLREGYGLSQRDLAALLGVTQASIAHWELGRHRIPALVVRVLEDRVIMERLQERAA